VLICVRAGMLDRITWKILTDSLEKRAVTITVSGIAQGVPSTLTINYLFCVPHLNSNNS
jgi:hypothetical protein